MKRVPRTEFTLIEGSQARRRTHVGLETGVPKKYRTAKRGDGYREGFSTPCSILSHKQTRRNLASGRRYMSLTKAPCCGSSGVPLPLGSPLRLCTTLGR